MPVGGEAIFAAFWLLTSDRPMHVHGISTMAGQVIESVPGRIPFTAIDVFARRYDVAGEAFDQLVKMIGEMDAEFIAFWQERLNARSAKG